MQAIVWLEKPLHTSIGEVTIIVANVLESDLSDRYIKLDVNDDLELVPDYSHVIVGDNVDPAMWGVSDGEGGLIAGALDVRR